MASRCPREKGNISLAGPANNPGNRTITRSPCECAHQPTPLFIDTFRAKTTDIAKREPITKSRLSLSYHAETFSLVSPRVPLILVPFFFFSFSRFFFCSTTSVFRRMLESRRTTSLTDSGSIYSQMPRPRERWTIGRPGSRGRSRNIWIIGKMKKIFEDE